MRSLRCKKREYVFVKSDIFIHLARILVNTVLYRSDKSSSPKNSSPVRRRDVYTPHPVAQTSRTTCHGDGKYRQETTTRHACMLQGASGSCRHIAIDDKHKYRPTHYLFKRPDLFLKNSTVGFKLSHRYKLVGCV